jgi:hypothetical protein
MVLMNNMLKHTWRTYKNRNWLGKPTKTKIGLEIALPQFITWAFSKVNDNQPINLSKNQIMRCIIYHNETTPFKILAIHTRCRKGHIAFYKFNGITTMKKHVESYHYTLLKNFFGRSNKPCLKIFTQLWAK